MFFLELTKYFREFLIKPIFFPYFCSIKAISNYEYLLSGRA
jgi:hypothetical protein